jgi:hypothetical protein
MDAFIEAPDADHPNSTQPRFLLQYFDPTQRLCCEPKRVRQKAYENLGYGNHSLTFRLNPSRPEPVV